MLNSLLNKYFEANISQYEKSYADIRCEANIRCNIYFLHQIKYLYANMFEHFEANMKRMMQINGVCENTETCEHAASKIHTTLD
jgi:hypothetical protein